MGGFLLRRTLLAMGVVAGAGMLIFLLIYAVPGDPATTALGPRATPEMRAAFRAAMGLDRPLPVQMARFFARLLHGDLGRDIWSGRPVSEILFEALPHTLILALCSLGWAALLGIVLGCASAARPGRAFDRIAGALGVATIAIPPFLVAIYCLLLFAVELRWFPAIGAGTPGDWTSQLRALVLPSFSVGLAWVGYIARALRGSLIDVMRERHIAAARAFGLPERTILLRHALRIALVPVVSIVGVGFGSLLSGSVLAEIVFARPGLGKTVYAAVLARNYPVVTGAVVLTAGLYAAIMLLTDLAISLLDQRSRAAL
jgi:peptide/nickel transport system permease protein